MLSVCLPLYNFDITGLVQVLHHQTERLNTYVEIVCIDDCSAPEFRKKNKDVCNQLGKYIQLEQNIGRAKIRNLFLEYTHSDYLLFLDCDSVIITNDFIKKYMEAITHGAPPIICGGRVYNEIKPSRHKLLRWKYGRSKESVPVDIRQRNPNKSFITSNFAIRRDVLSQIKFDERLVQYGHEDTLFGFQLKINHISIVHIDNPILNGDLEDNADFLAKTELGLNNLAYITDYVHYNPRFIEDVNLLKCHRTCRRYGIAGALAVIFPVLKFVLKPFLSSGYGGVFWLDVYKLSFFSKEFLKKRNHHSFPKK